MLRFTSLSARNDTPPIRSRRSRLVFKLFKHLRCVIRKIVRRLIDEPQALAKLVKPLGVYTRRKVRAVIPLALSTTVTPSMLM